MPVGALPLTVAVKVTDGPSSDGFTDDDSDVVVALGPGALTNWFNVDEMLVRLFASPL